MRPLLLLFGLTIGPIAASEAEPAAKAPAMLQKSEFTVLSAEGGKELGTWAIEAKLVEDGHEIVIEEKLELVHDGKRVGYQSTVRCAAEAPYAPREAQAETVLAGRVCMRGKVQFGAKSVCYAGTTHLDGRGEPLAEPLKFGKTGMPLPQGPLLMQSALPVVGPLLLKGKSQLDGVFFGEFPDDIDSPELINVKGNHRVVKLAVEEGGYILQLYDALGEEPKATLRYDAQGALQGGGLFGKFRLARKE